MADEELGATYLGMRESSQQRRARNRESTPQVLRERGIEFEERNGGAHLIVRHEGEVVDLWPGTGKWIVRGSNLTRRGVFRLLEYWGIGGCR